jgi:ribosome-binding protein aMBF1 (putative translation factor)
LRITTKHTQEERVRSVERVERTPAEVFPPGEFIREEIEVRGWSQVEFAEILGRPPRLISELIAGKRFGAGVWN